LNEEAPPALNLTGQRQRGAVEGVSVPATEAQTEANRVQAWRHGKYARFVTRFDADRQRLKLKLGADAPDVMEDFADHLLDGDSSGTDMHAVMSLATTELVRRKAAEELGDGVTIEEAVYSKDGSIIGHRTVAHPAAKIMLEAASHLGQTAADRLLTPKSRGEGERDQALVALAAHDRLLRSADKARCPPPPPSIDARLA
jgi:hypothetical protein